MDGFAIAAGSATALGVAALAFLRGRPELRAWAWPVLALTLGGLTILLFMLIPVAFSWLWFGST
jgi:hypothetical protein